MPLAGSGDPFFAKRNTPTQYLKIPITLHMHIVHVIGELYVLYRCEARSHVPPFSTRLLIYTTGWPPKRIRWDPASFSEISTPWSNAESVEPEDET